MSSMTIFLHTGRFMAATRSRVPGWLVGAAIVGRTLARAGPVAARPKLDLAGQVVTADALHTQREHADWLVSLKHAAYILFVRANPRTLHQLSTLPWRQVPVADHTHDRGHHRVEIRRLQATTVAGLDPPPRHPGDPHHPPGPVPAPPPLGYRDGGCGHQPHRRPGPPRPPGRLDD